MRRYQPVRGRNDLCGRQRHQVDRLQAEQPQSTTTAHDLFVRRGEWVHRGRPGQPM